MRIVGYKEAGGVEERNLGDKLIFIKFRIFIKWHITKKWLHLGRAFL